MKDNWNKSEPPKDRWIIRWDEYLEKPLIVRSSLFPDHWCCSHYIHSNERFTNNLWMEAPQKPEI